jgi:hypothetical protein
MWGSVNTIFYEGGFIIIKSEALIADRTVQKKKKTAICGAF